MSQPTLTPIVSGSIQLGPIPFDLYASDPNNRIVLFCRSGFAITEHQKEVLKTADRMFFVSSTDINAFHDYVFERLNSIVNDENINSIEKFSVVKDVGKRIVQNLFDDPRSGVAIQHSGRYVKSYLELILESQIAMQNLFSFSSRTSFALSHSINVCTFCLLLGEKLYGEKKDILWTLGLGGLLLDVGMFVVDEEVLERTGPLTSPEKAIVQNHPQKSKEIMSHHGLPEEVLAMGSEHHERADGSGYPRGLKLSQIHPYARIAAVADVYDAMTSKRSYHNKKPHIQALAEMSLNKHLYDPIVLKALFRIVLHREELVDKFFEGGEELKRLIT